MSEKRIRRSDYVAFVANLLLLGILAIQPSISSAETYWTDHLGNGATTLSESVTNKNGTGEFREVSFDLPSLRAALTPTMAKSSYAPIISFPQPDGGFKRFVVEPSGIIPEGLSAKFPHLLTYKGYAIDDPTISIRFEVTHTQINAQILEPGNRWMIDAQPSRGEGRAISFYSGKTLRQSGAQFCELETPHSSKEKEHSHEKKSLLEGQAAKSRGDILRTYRLAVATTGEYGQFHGGQTASVLSAVATTINRVVGILEQEVSISLVLVENNDKILYTIGLNDPFTGNNDASTLIGESQTVIDTQIGTDNYDIGHTLSTGAGGLAALGSVCSSAYKARGVTGSGQPQGDYFDVDFVAHEIGHQLGANHTFNGSSGGCSGGNRNYLTAYEPGSGSTIQAYPSLCGPDDLQNSVDPIYHSESFEEIYDFVTEGEGASCGVTNSTGNTPPQVNAGADYTVPRSTPLILNGSAVDAEQSNLTFLWEQRDLGDQAALSAPDDGEIPLFRVFTPSTRSDRYLPRLNAVVSGNFSDDEKIPQVAREMDFRLTARDGVGGVSSDDMVVSVVASAGPFVISSPNGGESVGRSKTITWDVANTDQEPISTSEVEILLSTNGGVTFDQSLGTVPNDGSANLTFPAGLQTSSARIMIKAANSIFYDVSDANFELDSDRLVPPSPTRASVSPSNGGATIRFTPGEDNGVAVTSYVAACSSSDSTEEFSYSIQPDLFFNELAAVSSTLAVDADLVVESGGLKVPVDISHTYRGDVVIALTSPSGTSVTLKTNLGSDEGVDVVGIYPDTLAPEQSLDGFVGESVAGDWVLNVSDAYEADQGTFNSWGLTFLRVTTGDEITQSGSQSPILLSGLNNGVTYSCQVTAYAGDDPSEAVDLGSVTPTDTSHTVTPSAGAGGSISPSTPQSVTEGASVEFELTPEEGYGVDNVGGSCGGSLSGTTFTTNAITQDCSVSATFTQLQGATYIVTPSAGSGGSISPSTPQTVTEGATVEFELTPEQGYSIDSVGGSCGGSLSGTTFTTNAITQNCSVSAAFTQLQGTTYIVTPSASTGGSISPSTPQTVAEGATVEFELAPVQGYGIDNVGGTCGGSLSGSTFTTNAITQNCSVAAGFTRLRETTYTVTPSSGSGGSISPSTPQTVNEGATIEFELTPGEGYAVDSVGGSCGGSLSGSTFTTNAITQDCSVVIQFVGESGLPLWMIYITTEAASTEAAPQ